MIQSIQKELQESGFDLCHPIHTSWYNNLIKDEGLVDNGTLKTLPEPSPFSSTSATLDDNDHQGGAIYNYNALLIGNTKKIWPIFLNWLASKVEQHERKNDENGNDFVTTDQEAFESVMISPFDTFVEESITRALQRCIKVEGHSSKLKSYEFFWSNGNRRKVNIRHEECSDDDSVDSADNDSEDGTDAAVGDVAENHDYHCYEEDNEHSFLVSMQRVATITGQYWHDEEATKLCVHPEYGTWTAFRTVLVFETSTSTTTTTTTGGLPTSPPSPCPCPISEEEIRMAKTIFDHALRISSSDDHGYGATLNKSWEELCDYLHGTVCSGSKWENVPDSMKAWIQLRDCIGVGREKWKYADAQLLYHYTKDSEILSRELDRIR